ncbi:MAG: hypothetical protein IKZ39_02570, partial [Lachnospiraceae bacterium]|nr:hypothetical protein [Lachnospiraceae bacterium]
MQLALTIGKYKIYSSGLQPVVIAAFDAERIVFLEYDRIMPLFAEPWVDWNITPSDHGTEMFKRVRTFLKESLSYRMIFNWIDDEKALKKFIKSNFKRSSENIHKIEINRTSFVSVYFRWREQVKDTIAVDWSVLAKNGIHDRDFFLADLISSDGKTLRDNLAVTLKQDIYKVHKQIAGMGFFADVPFKDKQKAYNLFWNSYSRPPKEEYWNYILDRADLLVPEDRRAYEGAYYTPRIWVEKSHFVLSEIFGDLWQEDYVIWDCAAGSGNLLRGLTNRRNVWASTDLQGDVDRMHSSIDAHDLNLFKSHVFQFDFLDDDLDGPKVPEQLKEILRSPEKRRKLIFLVNTPFAEAADKDTVVGSGTHKSEVATRYKTYSQYKDIIGIAAREIYAQFLMKMYKEVSGCIIAQFSTPKHLTAPNFYKFRSAFQAFLFEPKFVVPSKSFDNVKGEFPIGFFVWDTSLSERFSGTEAKYFDRKGNSLGVKRIPSYDGLRTINDWIIETRVRGGTFLGFMFAAGCDFQHMNQNFIVSDRSMVAHPRGTDITDKNFLEICVYHAVRHCM